MRTLFYEYAVQAFEERSAQIVDADVRKCFLCLQMGGMFGRLHHYGRQLFVVADENEFLDSGSLRMLRECGTKQG